MNKINFIHIPKNGGLSLKQICKNNKRKLIYNSHKVNVKTKRNQLIILRNPIDRFISSIYYCIEKYSHEEQIKKLIERGINTPDKWVEVWSNPNHEYYDLLMKEMLNVNHKIGNKKPKYKWTYCKQIEWFNNPKFIIIMDNYKKEVRYLLSKLGIRNNIQKINSTVKKDKYLSEKSIIFLQEYFKEDFEIYNKYKNMRISKRFKF